MAARVSAEVYGNAGSGGVQPPGERDDLSGLRRRTVAAATEALATGGAAPANKSRTPVIMPWWDSNAAHGCIAMSVFAASVAVLVGVSLGVKYLASLGNQ